MCTHVCTQVPEKPEEARSPGTGVIGGYEPHGMGAENRLQSSKQALLAAKLSLQP